MNYHCPVTGETDCKCSHQKQGLHPLKVDLKAALRKVFTDHAVYTRFVIVSMLGSLEDLNVMIWRLLRNQTDIAHLILPIIGEDNAKTLANLLTEHIKLAAEVGKSSLSRDSINSFMENGVLVGRFLSSLNPEKLPIRQTVDMFLMHNNFVIKMMRLRVEKRFEEDQEIFDEYYNHMLEVSDAIYEAL